MRRCGQSRLEPLPFRIVLKNDLVVNIPPFKWTLLVTLRFSFRKAGFDPHQVERLLHRKARWLLTHPTASPVQLPHRPTILSVGKASGSVGIPYGSQCNTNSAAELHVLAPRHHSVNSGSSTIDARSRDPNPVVRIASRGTILGTDRTLSYDGRSGPESKPRSGTHSV